MTKKPTIRLGLIGSGFMGKTHTFGFAAAARVFDLPYDVEMATLADVSKPLAESAAAALGFAKSIDDWRTLVADPDIDIIDITAPNALHKEMALAAIAAGKHVYCEKPLAPLASDAREMAEAAEAVKVKTQVGFNYLCNPMLAFARDMIAARELGEIRTYRGVHAEDYMADAATPFTFRHDPAGGGALADIGSHALATAEFLLGPIAQVMGDCVTMIRERPDAKGGRRAVEVDDVGRAFVRFENGATGSIEANWLATGRKMQHDFEVYGTKGALAFTQERFNELLFLFDRRRRRAQGFPADRGGPRPSALWAILCRLRSSTRLQRSQGDRGRRLSQHNRRQAPGALQLPRRTAHPDARRDDPEVVAGGALASSPAGVSGPTAPTPARQARQWRTPKFPATTRS